MFAQQPENAVCVSPVVIHGEVTEWLDDADADELDAHQNCDAAAVGQRGQCMFLAWGATAWFSAPIKMLIRNGEDSALGVDEDPRFMMSNRVIIPMKNGCHQDMLVLEICTFFYYRLVF